MLNKDICIRCYEEHRATPWHKLPSKERMWAQGKIACVAGLDKKRRVTYVRVNEAAPDCCYYALEHLLTMQKKEAGHV